VLFVARCSYVWIDCVNGSAAQVHSLGVFRSLRGFSSDPVCRAYTTHQTMVHGFIDPAGSRCEFLFLWEAAVPPITFSFPGAARLPQRTAERHARARCCPLMDHVHGRIRRARGRAPRQHTGTALVGYTSSWAGFGKGPVGL